MKLRCDGRICSGDIGRAATTAAARGQQQRCIFKFRQQSLKFGFALIMKSPQPACTDMTYSTPECKTPAEEQVDLVVRGDLMARKEVALESLNTRIARLAIALGLELGTDVGLRSALAPGLALTPHQQPFLEELRALLTLRYQMEKQLVEELGSQTLHTMIFNVEQHMERMGFKHGIDGLRQDPLP